MRCEDRPQGSTMQGIGIRPSRKDEHIQAVRVLPELSLAGFEDVVLLPASAGEVDWDEISLATSLFGIPVASPVTINAMTGGTETARAINARLGRFARRHGLAMAVGSETAALRDSALTSSYTVVRDVNPDGLVLANVGMGTSADLADRAVRLVGAGVLQVHWNIAQELVMREGDRHFRGAIERLREVAEAIKVPIVAKEVGQGMTGAAVSKPRSSGH